MWALRLVSIWLLSCLVASTPSSMSDSEETYYAAGALEMLARSDYVTPYFAQNIRLDKPPMQYWLIAAAITSFGPHAEVVRFPSALAHAGIALLLWVYCGTVGRALQLPAVCVYLTLAGVSMYARSALPDSTWALGISGSVLAFWIANARCGTQRTWWSIGTVFLLGIATLTKGPMALAWFAATAVTSSYVSASSVSFLSVCKRAVILAAGAALIAFPWWVLILEEHGPSFLSRTLVVENYDRFLTERFGRWSPTMYLSVLPVMLLPWIVFVPWITRIKDASTSFVSARSEVVAILLPALALWLSRGQQPRYVLPLLPFLALVLARCVLCAGFRARGWLLLSLSLASALATAAATYVTWAHREQTVLDTLMGAAAFGVCALCLTILSTTAFDRQRVAHALCLAAISVSVSLSALASARLGEPSLGGLLAASIAHTNPSLETGLFLERSIAGSVMFNLRRSAQAFDPNDAARLFARLADDGAPFRVVCPSLVCDQILFARQNACGVVSWGRLQYTVVCR